MKYIRQQGDLGLDDWFSSINGPLRKEWVDSISTETVKIVPYGFKSTAWRATATDKPRISVINQYEMLQTNRPPLQCQS